MGMPKGLVRLKPGGPSFLKIIDGLYRDLDFSTCVVVASDQAVSYRNELQATPGVRVIEGEAGGDTALTLALAWRELKNISASWTHLWAHPVDLPLVGPDTIKLLLKESGRHPTDLVRPFWKDQPGHPVVFPAAFLQELETLPGWRERPLHHLLIDSIQRGRATAPRVVQVADKGVVHDFDCPEDLPPASPTSPDRGAP
jgi:CTP:molybdopterin cytidylyltransferase MocA